MREARSQEIYIGMPPFVFPLTLKEVLTNEKLVLPTFNQLGNLFRYMTVGASDEEKESFKCILNKGFFVNHTLMCGIPRKGGKLAAIMLPRDDGLNIFNCLPTELSSETEGRAIDMGEHLVRVRRIKQYIREGQIHNMCDPPTGVPLIASFFDSIQKNRCLGFFFEYYSGDNSYPLWATLPDKDGDYWVKISRQPGPPPILNDMKEIKQESHLLIEGILGRPDDDTIVIGLKSK